MDEHTSISTLARRTSPYGLAVMPEKDQYEYTDPRNEAAVERRWRPICEQHGAAILGIRAVPTSKIRIDLDGVEWELAPAGTAERLVPAVVYHRCRALEAAGVPMLYWLWGEEQAQRPTLRPMPETTASRPMRWSEGLAKLLDPILIGVIPTAPQRGIWVITGRWFH